VTALLFVTVTILIDFIDSIDDIDYMRRILTPWQKAHQKYLQTEHWKNLRESAIKRDGGKCIECGDTTTLNVHHKVYRKRFEDGVLEDVVTLCKMCHRIEHGRRVYFPFDYKILELRQLLNYSILPTPEQERELVSLILCEEDEQETRGLFRYAANTRIGKHFDLWLKKPTELHKRLWPWSYLKLKRIQNEINSTQ
jgi:hypothetical protein